MTTQEIKEALVEAQISYDKTKMGHTISPMENPVSLRDSRKTIARLNTELRSREINGEQ